MLGPKDGMESLSLKRGPWEDTEREVRDKIQSSQGSCTAYTVASKKDAKTEA